MITTPISSAVKQISDYLESSDGNILFFAPGGSAINTAVQILNNLSPKAKKQLVCTLTDERYVAIDHSDSNFKQYQMAGIESDIKFVPVINSGSITDCARDWSDKIDEYHQNNYKFVGLFGIGKDGHIAGIKPGKLLAENFKNTICYAAEDFQRITIASRLFKQFDQAYIWANDPQKQPVIDRLSQSVDPIEMPAQYIKDAKNFKVYYTN